LLLPMTLSYRYPKYLQTTLFSTFCVASYICVMLEIETSNLVDRLTIHVASLAYG